MRSSVLVPALLLLLARTAAAQTPAPPPQVEPVVVAVGEGVVKRTPDRAWVSIAAESRARTAREAQKLNADAMTGVLAKIKASGIPADAIQTSGYGLQPEFDYADNRQRLRGYVARNSVDVRVDDLPKLGGVLEAAVDAGANHVSGVRFDLQARDAVEREALKLAVADARARADAAAAGAGLKVERVVRIEEERYASAPRPMAMMRESLQATSGEPPISPGEIEIRASVRLTAAIR